MLRCFKNICYLGSSFVALTEAYIDATHRPKGEVNGDDGTDFPVGPGFAINSTQAANIPSMRSPENWECLRAAALERIIGDLSPVEKLCLQKVLLLKSKVQSCYTRFMYYHRIITVSVA